MIRKTFFLQIAIMLIFTACNENSVNIEKEKQIAVEETMKKQEAARKHKLDVINKFYGVFTNGDMSVLDEILDPKYTQYPSDPGQTPDIEGFIKHAQMFGNMFSDLKGTQTHIVIDKDLVHVRSELEVTHSGNVFGISATNKRIKLTAFDLHHFNKDGKIDKTWHLEDFWGAYSQIKSK